MVKTDFSAPNFQTRRLVMEVAREQACMNELVVNLAHELRNPLSSILTYANLVPRVGPVTAQQGRYLERIQCVTGQISELVSQLLELAGVEARSNAPPQGCNLCLLLANITCDLLARANAKRQTLTFSLPADLPLVKGDPHQLGLVLNNLIGNALKYTPAEGHVAVRFKACEASVCVEVQDNGIGIPPDDLPHVFDRFYRVRTEATREIEGNGLGLAIVKSVVAQYGGAVAVESVLGQGSCFRVSLPVALRPACAEMEAAR
jgi:signal transduction histidine kinase